LAFWAGLASFFAGLGVALVDWDFVVEVDFPEEKPPENFGSSFANDRTGSASSAIRTIFKVFMVLEIAKSDMSVALAEASTASLATARARRFEIQSGRSGGGITADKPDAQRRQGQ